MRNKSSKDKSGPTYGNHFNGYTFKNRVVAGTKNVAKLCEHYVLRSLCPTCSINTEVEDGTENNIELQTGRNQGRL